MARNSDFSGSGASIVIIFMQSSSGKPALTPRTIMSTASGNPLRNFDSRRFFKYDSSQYGRPKAPAKPSPMAGTRPALLNSPAMNITAPMPAEMMANCRFDHDKPACAIRVASGTRFCFLWRSSNSLSVFSMMSRRDFCGPRVARVTVSALATLAMRCSALVKQRCLNRVNIVLRRAIMLGA